MSQLPRSLDVRNFQQTPVNVPLVGTIPAPVIEDQPNIQSLVPRFDQYARTKKINLTGRGLNVSFNISGLGTTAGDMYVAVSRPLPFQGLVRSMGIMNENAATYTVVNPCYTKGVTEAIVTSAQLGALTPMFTPANGKEPFPLFGWLILAAYTPMYVALNFLLPAPDMKIATLLYSALGGASAGVRVWYEVMEVVPD